MINYNLSEKLSYFIQKREYYRITFICTTDISIYLYIYYLLISIQVKLKALYTNVHKQRVSNS